MSDGLRPRTVSCGCCTGGCTCWLHRPDFCTHERDYPKTCDYHREHPHPHVTERFDPSIHIPQ